VQLDVQHAINPSSSTNSSAATANGNSGSCPPPAAAIAAAVQQLQQELLTPQLTFVTEAGAAAEEQQQPAPLLVCSSSRGTVQDAFGSNSSSSSQCVSLLPLQSSSSSSSSNTDKPAAPMFEFEPCQQQQQQQISSVSLSLDVLTYAPITMQLSKLPSALLLPALQTQLATMQDLLQQQASQRQQLSPLRACHFTPPGLGFPVAVCYPLAHQSLETAELKLMPRRQQLHKLLGLPGNVPMLRFANALDWSSSSSAVGVPRSLRLRNVHEGLPAPGERLVRPSATLHNRINMT
jgi:hypothetical protein